ncbi:putative coxI translation protein CYA5 [Rosellinia necatrix]|uniref:Putative coxI translation protein CYA5 n=1 Tax=Rosellinia necatrix TaxID=77044 RepID=A0A1W2TE34_ROSNE|nr:putative coxI translation protein CYA5 [Rosellinia necatrix]
MLERTAACLEPCSLRALPSHKNALRSTRQLHTAFWQHGAADVELTTAWQALMHGTPDTDPAVPEQAGSPSLSASTFLLDFLYPAGAVAFMHRRLSPIYSARPDRLRFRTRPSHVSPRLYNSSLSRQQLEATTPPAQRPSDSAEANNEIDAGAQDSAELGGPGHSITFHNLDHAAAIKRILENNNLNQVDLLWRHYKSSNERSQNAYFHRILTFLSTTGRVSDSWRVSELFQQLDVSSWDDNTFFAGVSAEINLQNFPQALVVFQRGLRSTTLNNTALIDTLDLLLAYAFRSSSTAFLEEIWKLYPDMASRWDFPGITADLKRLASISGLAEKAMALPEYMDKQLSKPSSSGADREAWQALQKILVRKALASCEDSQVIPLLLLTKDLLAFEEYIRFAAREGKRKVTTTLVYAIYRELPDCVPSHAVLHCVFHAYTEMGASVSRTLAGVDLLWADWLKFHNTPSRRAYQKHLGFYATQGNKERVYSLWAEYIERFRDDPTVNIFSSKEGSDTFAHLLHVHAVNAEPEEARRIFDDMTNKFRIQPSIYDWNILLNAYVKADDYDGAIETFDNLCEAARPDKYSYGTLMQMAGSRGDLGFTVDLYRRARSSGVSANDAMLSSLVDAYCQNDLFTEAEDICTRATNKGIVVTRMWNKLLYYNALRRDLASINEILNTMADKNVPYNRFTYQQLLLGLGLCRQSQHALHLITVALRENVFEVTPTHFQIVMGSILRTGEPTLVRSLCSLMNKNGVPITEEVVFRLSQALLQWQDLTPQERRLRNKKQWLGDALRTFFRIYRHSTGAKARPETTPHPKPVPPRELLRSGREVYQFSTVMSVFAQLNDSIKVNELIDLYRYVFQDTSDNEGVLPFSMLNAVMLSSLQDQRYDRVRATWGLLFENAKSETRSADFNENLPHTNKISPKYRYALSGGLRVMQEMLFKEGDSSGIRDLIRTVREAGFEVDSKNWNFHVQAMAQMRQYKEAFATCEKLLMPNWTGWQIVRAKAAMRNALPLDTRRKGSSPRYLRPTATTLYRLAQAYLELDKQGHWSGDASATFREVENDCPQVVRAIKSMIRVYSNLEAEIFDSPDFAGIADASRLEK